MLERNWAIQCASDRETMLEALKQSEYALNYAAQELKAQRNYATLH